MTNFFSAMFAMVLVTALMGCATVKNNQPLTAGQVIKALNLEPMGDAACPGYFKPTYASKVGRI